MVYYNPEKPSEALLECSTLAFFRIFWILLVILDIFLCGLGAVLLLAL